MNIVFGPDEHNGRHGLSAVYPAIELNPIRVSEATRIQIDGNWLGDENLPPNTMGYHLTNLDYMIGYFTRTLNHEILHLVLFNKIDLPRIAALKKAKAIRHYVETQRASHALDSPRLKGMLSIRDSKTGEVLLEETAWPDMFDEDGMPKELLG